MKKTLPKRLTAVFLCVCLFFSVLSLGAAAAVRDTSYEELLARDLKTLGLFKGVSDTDFDLDRAPTRIEALVMLIRVLGRESDALGGSWVHPFTDVPEWADNYVGYAYENGLTNGISSSEYGVGSANAQMYLTFVLRALGYSDTEGRDFTYSDPFTLARSVGILPDCVHTDDFWRADVVLISYAALAARLKGSAQTLAQKLIADGVFTKPAYQNTYDSSAIAKYPADVKIELNAEQIYAGCAPAVFYIEVADSTGTVYASGSGFFILSDGTAVTNYHVIDGAYSAKITLSSTNSRYDVLGVYDYNEEEDWAVLKIDGSGFPCLEIADTPAVVGGAKCYAIGSPKGLQSSISEGIISNPSRELDGMTYIQTSAAISHGSSGGALINKYGQVIGITSAGYEDGENLGFAIPISLIEGYSRSQYTALSALFPETAEESPAQYAYDLLSAFTVIYGEESFDGWYEYSEIEYNADGFVRYFIYGDEGTVGVQREEYYQGSLYYTTAFFSPDTLYQYVGFSIYGSETDQDPIFSGGSLIYAPYFYGDNMTLDTVTENTLGLDVETCGLLASYQLQDLLFFTDYIYSTYLYDFGDLGVYLFGFTNYDYA